MSGFDLFRGDALNAYRDWPAPATIVSDGAYGVRGFHGDTIGPEVAHRRQNVGSDPERRKRA